VPKLQKHHKGAYIVGRLSQSAVYWTSDNIITHFIKGRNEFEVCNTVISEQHS